jgi:hypothetical protein
MARISNPTHSVTESIVKENHMYSQKMKFVCTVLASAGLALVPMGCKKAPPLTLTAEANPPAIFPGQPVTVTATAGSVDPNKKNHVVYSWSGTGVTGNGPSATVATETLTPGAYTVKADAK